MKPSTVLVVDTEFTGFSDDAKLISIALVSPADGGHIYVELRDGWSIDDCSEFVRENVLTKLDLERRGVSTATARQQISCFIKSFSADVVLASDSPAWDGHLLRQLLDVETDGLAFEFSMLDLSMLADDEEQGIRHNALSDALSLAEKYNQFIEKYAESLS